MRRRPEAPSLLPFGQAAAVPTSGLLRVSSEAPPFNEFETTDDSDAPKLPASGGFRAAPTVTAGCVAAVILQHGHRTHTSTIIYVNLSLRVESALSRRVCRARRRCNLRYH
jgi:hypothetical protein